MPKESEPGDRELELLIAIDPTKKDLLAGDDYSKYVAGLFYDEEGREVQFPFSKFTGKAYTVLGTSGSGKSSFVRSFIYFVLLPFKYQFSIFDVEGEYYKLADRFPDQIQLWDERLKASDAERLAREAILGLKSTIIDCSNSSMAEFTVFAYEYLENLWHFADILRHDYEMNMPHMCILEEAQELAKQWPNKDNPFEIDALDTIKKYARRGRKYGPAIMLVSQRIPAMNIEAVSQTQIKFLLKTNADVDRTRYRGWLSIGEKAINIAMNQMKPGQVIIYEGKVKRDEFGNVELPVYSYSYLEWADVSQSVVPSDILRLENFIKANRDELAAKFNREKLLHPPIKRRARNEIIAPAKASKKTR